MNEVVSQPLETLYCQPDLGQLLSCSQAVELEPLHPVDNTQIETATTSGSQIVEQQNTLLTDGYVVNIQQVCAYSLKKKLT